MKLKPFEIDYIKGLSAEYLAALRVRSRTNPSSFDSNIEMLKSAEQVFNKAYALIKDDSEKALKYQAKSYVSHFSFLRERAAIKFCEKQQKVDEVFNLIFSPIEKEIKAEFAKEPRITQLKYNFKKHFGTTEKGKIDFRDISQRDEFVIGFSDGSTIKLDKLDPSTINGIKAQFENKMQELENQSNLRLTA